jgi:hypothetical protein
MFFAATVLIVSAALFFFYLQSTCEKVLRHQFDQEYFQSIAGVCQLEFPALRLAMDRHHTPSDYASVCAKLRADFCVISSMRDTADLNGRPRFGERLLDAYFHAILFCLPLLRAVGAGEKGIRKLSAILQYFANAVGEHFTRAQFAQALTPSQ